MGTAVPSASYCTAARVACWAGRPPLCLAAARLEQPVVQVHADEAALGVDDAALPQLNGAAHAVRGIAVCPRHQLAWGGHGPGPGSWRQQ